MKKLLLVTLLLASSAAFGQANVRVRGTITGVQGEALSVKTFDGKDHKVELAPNVGVATARAMTLADLKPNAYIGVSARKNADGSLVAIDIHTLSPQVPGGYNDNWDQGPGLTMTNANLEGVVQAKGGKSIALKYKDGTKTILVPEGTPVVDFDAADRSALKAGETIFAAARQEADGRLVAQRIFVSKGGARPGF
jgi:hypothetical protein